MNANSPGVQSRPKVSPLAENSSNGSAPSTPAPPTPQPGSIPPPPPPPSMGSLAMGMPFQVFPTGPAVKNNQQQLSAPQTNGNQNRKSPQSFEPPPMGCRPEIKIPANPMAILRSAPRPQVKGDFWVQEYVQEKARNSIPSEDEIRQQIALSMQPQQQSNIPTPPPQAAKQMSPIRYAQRSPSPCEEQKDYGQIRNIKLEDVRTASPIQGNRSPPVMSQSPVPSSLPSPITPVAKTVTIEPTQAYKQPQQSYQPMTQNYQPTMPNYQQPAQTYQQPQQNYQQPTQNYQQPSQGGRVILSTMPNRQHQGAQHNVNNFF
jgi:hypothetical protein